MVETFKILGQVSPAAAANTVLYTAPEKTQTVCSTLSVCNTNATPVTIRVFIVPSGGSASTSNALYYGLVIPANDTLTATIGVTLGADCSIYVYSSATLTCFQLFGSEVSPK